jgi:hypothetical protein
LIALISLIQDKNDTAHCVEAPASSRAFRIRNSRRRVRSSNAASEHTFDNSFERPNLPIATPHLIPYFTMLGRQPTTDATQAFQHAP